MPNRQGPQEVHRAKRPHRHGQSRFSRLEGSVQLGSDLTSPLGCVLSYIPPGRACNGQSLFLLTALLALLCFIFFCGHLWRELPASHLHADSGSTFWHQLSMQTPRSPPGPPGFTYHSQEFFDRMWPAMEAETTRVAVDKSAGFPLLPAWEHLKRTGEWESCFDRQLSDGGLPESTGYLIVEANGGLNQQRASICNAVAVARLLNATLVIPRFQVNSVWQDASEFGDIYDEEHFVRTLAKDVKIVKELPDSLMEQLEQNISNVDSMKVTAFAPPSFYLEKVLPKLRLFGVLQISPFANRLSYDGIPANIQRLRCRTNFEALRFTKPISSLGQKLVDRMLERSSSTGGNYLSVHLRFEKDIVAFSRCEYTGSQAEKEEMDEAREASWKMKFSRKRLPGADVLRKDGKCPLSPVEVGLELRGMGFGPATPIYIAAGKIYEEEKFLGPLKHMFPGLVTKETLLTPEELEPFKDYSSRMAALDYTVCLQSEVFVASHGGNFVSFLIGHRRFLNGGHSKTIRPAKRKMALLMDNPNIGWQEFSSAMQKMRRDNDVKGQESREPGGSIYTWPAPDCMCRKKQVTRKEVGAGPS